jgi:protein TonB
VGPGSGGEIGGDVFKVGGGISAPQAVSTPDPSYTEEARNAKAQGKCILWLIVDDTGHPRNIQVVRGLGYGLDAKAVEAVQQWRFQPAMKDGKPVKVQISVEVGFHLFRLKQILFNRSKQYPPGEQCRQKYCKHLRQI